MATYAVSDEGWFPISVVVDSEWILKCCHMNEVSILKQCVQRLYNTGLANAKY